MKSQGMRGISGSGVLLTAAAVMTGCTRPSSPSVPLFGAYFPSWLICLLAGVIGAVIVRVIMVRIGIDEGLPFRLLTYTGVAAIIGFTLALTVFGR